MKKKVLFFCWDTRPQSCFGVGIEWWNPIGLAIIHFSGIILCPRYLSDRIWPSSQAKARAVGESKNWGEGAMDPFRFRSKTVPPSKILSKFRNKTCKMKWPSITYCPHLRFSDGPEVHHQMMGKKQEWTFCGQIFASYLDLVYLKRFSTVTIQKPWLW